MLGQRFTKLAVPLATGVLVTILALAGQSATANRADKMLPLPPIHAAPAALAMPSTRTSKPARVAIV